MIIISSEVYLRLPFVLFLGLRVLNSFSQKRINEAFTSKAFDTSPIEKYLFSCSISRA
jgi:hypothetical protein